MAGQHDIQNHQIERLCLHQVEAFFSGVCDADRIIVGLQPFLEGLRHFLFVLHYQDVHAFFIGALGTQVQVTRP